MIKAILFALFVGLLMVGCGDITVGIEDLEYRNGVSYLLNEETPFTGRAESFYDNGQKKWEENYKDGKKDGLFISYKEDGAEDFRATYKDGKRVDDNLLLPGKKIHFKSRDGEGPTWTASFFENGIVIHSARPKGTYRIKGLTAFVVDAEPVKVVFKKPNIAVGDVFCADSPSTKETLFFKILKVEALSEVDLPMKSIDEVINEIDSLLDNMMQHSIKQPVEDEEKTEIEEAVDWSKLHDRDGVTYLLGTDNPYTGYATLHKNGLIGSEMSYKEGKPHGLWTKWYKNGQKASEMNFDEGKSNGTWTEWYENEQKKSETIWKDGKLTDGFRTSWYENGQKKEEINFKDGKRNGFATFYNMDGTVERRESYKDDKRVKD
jgi:antitoxin component YwqK of YwqJK toxin-antitoxin module